MSSLPEPGSYPGNPALPREVREKILSTFRHTLNLFKEGKIDDCLIGCDFILKMDPRFTPARQLLEKSKNPAAGIDVAALEQIVLATPTRQERVASVETDRLLVRAAESYNARDFDAAVAAAEQVLQVLPGNQDATQILEKARQKKNAAPQFEAARQRAVGALEAQRPAEARAAVEKMRSLDAEHPAVSLLERKLTPEPREELGESTNPGIAPRPAPQGDTGGGLDALSLDSLSLDDPMDAGAFVPPPAEFGGPDRGPLSQQDPGPLSLSDDLPDSDTSASAYSSLSLGESGTPPNLWSDVPEEPSASAPYEAAPSAAAFSPSPMSSFEPEPPSPHQEIESLLARGDDAANAGNRQQAIEMWSRIFLIDINNSDAVGRIEKARQEMAEGNRRIAENLKKGRESFEAGDFPDARESFLRVLAADETDATARSYLDRIEQELARPSSGLDLSKKSPQRDILDEEMAETSEPLDREEAEEAKVSRTKEPPAARAPRRPMDKRFLMALGGALVLALAVGGYLMMRPGPGGAAAPPAPGGPSLEHATMLFREGKVAETIAELRKIPAGHPDHARAQKLLASLTRDTGETGTSPGDATEPAAGEKPAAPAGPPAEALQQRAEAERALSEKRYIDALKSFALAAPAFSGDPTFTQSMGAASEKVNELTPAVKLYNEGEYDTAIPILWRIVQADRSNQDARSYLLRSYYNQGIAQLQNGLYPKAVESFTEVLAVDPGDTAAARHKKLAERYLKGDLDLMGRIYVRHIQQRP